MCKSFASQSCTSRSLGWGQVRGRGSPSKSHFLENPRNSVHSSCSASENTQKMLHFLTCTQEKCWGLWGCAQSRKWGQRIQGHQVEENSWSPQSHLPPGAHYHQNHLPPATFNCMIFVLFFMLCFCSGFMLKLIKYVGVSAWQTAREENKTFHLQASAPHLDKQEQHKWTVGQHWGGIAPLSAPNHQWKWSCGPEKMKSAIPRRRWKGTTQAGALLMALLWLCRSPFFGRHKRTQASHLKVPQGTACC